jgi:polar amino acid transport system substrate-binding protein
LLLLVSTAGARPNVASDLNTRGVLTVGTDSPYGPFEFGKPPHYKGFDIDLVNAIARKLELRVVIIDTPFGTIFTDLRRRKFDLVASATTITPVRKRYVRFTEPNFDARQSLLVRRGSSIRSIADLTGKIVGVQDGTTGESFANDNTGARKVVGFPTSRATIRALKAKRVNAVIIDEPVATAALKHGVRGVALTTSFSVGNHFAFAVRKRARTLHRGVNWAFDRVKAEGTFRRIYRKWFDMDPPPSLRR